jgi:MurNAc alpha-1-phosphate uridylyltransferase
LLRAGGRMLVEWQIERLALAGFTHVVVNHSHLGASIEEALGDGRRLGVRIRYSHEPRALETAGGVAQALPLLGAEPFVVVSGDIHTSFDYASLLPRMDFILRYPERRVAYFVLVDNPPWHSEGDMGLTPDGLVTREGPKLTYGNIGVFHPLLFADIAPGTFLKLFPWAYRFVDAGRVGGEHFRGEWDNVGTPAQLAALDRRLTR